jgi:hypothetical protein
MTPTRAVRCSKAAESRLAAEPAGVAVGWPVGGDAVRRFNFRVFTLSSIALAHMPFSPGS